MKKPNYSIDIFIKSYAKDFKLLYYAMESIKKNVTGYNKLCILVPCEDKIAFDRMFPRKNLPKKTDVSIITEYGNRYLFQQLCKMQAYKYCNSEYILFTDSDCLFDKPVNFQDIVKGGKPEILYTDYSKVEGAICWKEPTEKFMGEKVKWEYMRRNFLVYHKSTLEAIAKGYLDLEDIVMSSDRFSEFNCLGAYAFKNERKKYSFVNTDTWEYVEPLGIQLWSWFDKNSTEDNHIIETKKVLDAINSVFNLNLTEL